MIRQVDGRHLDLYQFGVWLASYNAHNPGTVRPAEVTDEMAREAIADRYDYTGLHLKRPGGLRFPNNSEHARAYAANAARRGRPKAKEDDDDRQDS